MCRCAELQMCRRFRGADSAGDEGDAGVGVGVRVGIITDEQMFK